MDDFLTADEFLRIVSARQFPFDNPGESTMTTKQVWTLTRTGDLPLKVQGELLASRSSEITNGQERNRWHAITVIQASKFVACVEWCSRWQGEPSHSTCLVADTLLQLADLLRDYDPLAHLIGFPDGAQFEKKQARLEQAIESDWDALLSNLFSELNVSETL